MKKYPVIVLAGHNTGVDARKEENDKKIWSYLFFDKYIARKSPLRMIKIKTDEGTEHMRMIDFVIDALEESSRISEKIVVGPKKRLEMILKGKKEFHTIAQGKNLYENMIKGFNYLEKRKYSGKVLFISGDIPFIKGENLDEIVDAMEEKDDGKSEIFYMMTPRKKIREFVISHDLEKYGVPIKMAYPFPVPFKMNRLGPVLKEGDKKDVYISGNSFFIDTNRVSSQDLEAIARLAYGMRKGIIDPRNWKFIFDNISFKKAFEALTGKYTISEAEEFMSQFKVAVDGHYKTFNSRIIRSPVEFAIDVDSRIDRQRFAKYYSREFSKER